MVAALLASGHTTLLPILLGLCASFHGAPVILQTLVHKPEALAFLDAASLFGNYILCFAWPLRICPSESLADRLELH